MMPELLTTATCTKYWKRICSIVHHVSLTTQLVKGLNWTKSVTVNEVDTRHKNWIPCVKSMGSENNHDVQSSLLQSVDYKTTHEAGTM